MFEHALTGPWLCIGKQPEERQSSAKTAGGFGHMPLYTSTSMLAVKAVSPSALDLWTFKGGCQGRDSEGISRFNTSWLIPGESTTTRCFCNNKPILWQVNQFTFIPNMSCGGPSQIIPTMFLASLSTGRVPSPRYFDLWWGYGFSFCPEWPGWCPVGAFSSESISLCVIIPVSKF